MTFADPSKKFSKGNLTDVLGMFGTGLGTSGQEATKGMSDNKNRDIQIKNAIIDAENLRLMREQNRLLKGGS